MPNSTHPPSQAAKVFQAAIKDAEVLLDQFDKLNTKPPPPQTEVFKRAGLIIALTAWETYIEDRLFEALQPRLQQLDGSPLAKFVESKFRDDIARLHNPNSAKTQKLFLDYLNIDVTKTWAWSGLGVPTTKKYLDTLVSKRGDAAHRSPASALTVINGHIVKREELEKGIALLKFLVGATDLALDNPDRTAHRA